MTMAVQDEKPKAVRPSLYIATRLACLVRQFRTLLKARVNSRAQLSKNQCQAFESLATGKLGRLAKLSPSRGRMQQRYALHSKHSITSARETASTTLLQHLDYHVTSGGHRLGTTALYDNLFLQHNVGQLLVARPAKEASHVLDITTLLLARLPHAEQTHAGTRKAIAPRETMKYEKFLANLEHLLLCLQEAALQALLRYSLGLLEAEIHQWHQYWQQRKVLDDDWFTEWPSGRRPLSTTWPWNIKPSLVVLWGVCWMFYVATPEYNSTGQAMPSESGWHAPMASPRNVEIFDSTATTNPEYYSPGWRSPQPGRVHGARNRSENYSGALVGQVHAGANAGPSFSGKHDSTLVTRALLTLRIGTGILQRSQRPANDPYIIPISPSYSSSPATVSASWPGPQGIGSTLREISHNDWQPTQDHINISTSPASPLSYPTSAISPYASEFQVLSDSLDNIDIWSCTPPFTQPGNLAPPPMPDTQNRYLSPQSEGSERGVTICPVMPANLSSTGQATSPVTDVSQLSRRPSSSNASPPRNLQGQMSCLHRECAAQPPTFSRKCEWTKHMDKHTRPYICAEPGCEKIQGFTYSGGLLRHQREVHKQHGGPKAPRMCPHRDCKRSSGTGFSRKENLNEHLRRVHRGVGIDAADSVAEPLSSGLKPPRRFSAEMLSTDGQRKRRREVEVDEDELDDEQEEEDFQAQIKRLRKQLAERDKKIDMLEAVVRRFLGGQNLSPLGR